MRSARPRGTPTRTNLSSPSSHECERHTRIITAYVLRPVSYPSRLRALGRAAERATWLRRPQELESPGWRTCVAPSALEVVEQALARADDGWLAGGDARLDAYGIPLVRAARRSTDDAVCAARLGYPAVVKSGAPGAHKTESSGVALDLGDDDAVRAAAERIGPPLIVQPCSRAPAVGGPRAGSGLRPARRLRAGRRLRGADRRRDPADRAAHGCRRRGARDVRQGRSPRRRLPRAPAADLGSLIDVEYRLAALGDDLPAVAELDLNPVLASPGGCIAVDARACASDGLSCSSARRAGSARSSPQSGSGETPMPTQPASAAIRPQANTQAPSSSPTSKSSVQYRGRLRATTNRSPRSLERWRSIRCTAWSSSAAAVTATRGASSQTST